METPPLRPEQRRRCEPEASSCGGVHSTAAVFFEAMLSSASSRTKRQRAEEIAKALADHKRWRSHGRNLDTVKLSDLRIEIDDYSDDQELRKLIREYNDPLTGFIDRMDISFFLHNRYAGP